jgi:diguanylate cyclase (GGDEF)-like protein/PAS domain S-box-containing protein
MLFVQRNGTTVENTGTLDVPSEKQQRNATVRAARSGSMTVMAQLGLAGAAITPEKGPFAQVLSLLASGPAITLHVFGMALVIGMAGACGILIGRLRAPSPKIKPGRERAYLGKLAMSLLDNLPDPLYVKDAKSRFLLANMGAAKNMGAASGAELLGKTDFDFFPEAIAAGFFEDEQRVMQSGQPMVSREETIEEADGRTRYVLSTKVPLFDAEGRVIGISGVGRDITKLKAVEAELEQARAELEFKATHDNLTALLNRGATLELLERELVRSVRENSSTAVLLADLDHFKKINDTHGHPVGDEVLLEVARRLTRTVRNYDLVGRYGGEEFLIVLPSCTPEDALTRAEQLQAAIAASPVETEHGPLSMSISIGVLVAQEWGNPSSAEILREVDSALYAAKSAGRNRCCVASPRLENDLSEQ